ncbi:Integrin beta-6 [Merluccius polli]|uniref:Integrin beta-6 n=1 Tax=Merluccius polli TaxID=89951 RepID=A0AA47NLZ6_MERPO|nr:Integrin beta-6 [Merluccius polli]
MSPPVDPSVPLHPTALLAQQMGHLSLGNSGTYVPASAAVPGAYMPQYTAMQPVPDNGAQQPEPLLHWRPTWGFSNREGKWKGFPDTHWSHQPRSWTATYQHQPFPNVSAGQRRRGEAVQQPSAASNPRVQPGATQVQPHLCQPAQQPKAPCSRRRRGSFLVALVEGGPTEGLPSCQASSKPIPATASQETPPPAKAAAPGLWFPGWRGGHDEYCVGCRYGLRLKVRSLPVYRDDKRHRPSRDSMRWEDARQGSCPSGSAGSCDECLSRSPRCAWCTQENFTNWLSVGERCDTPETLLEKGCLPDRLELHVSHAEVLLDSPLGRRTGTTNGTQISPQRMALKLRPGRTSTGAPGVASPRCSRLWPYVLR